MRALLVTERSTFPGCVLAARLRISLHNVLRVEKKLVVSVKVG
jgi:hypothetical protein